MSHEQTCPRLEHPSDDAAHRELCLDCASIAATRELLRGAPAEPSAADLRRVWAGVAARRGERRAWIGPAGLALALGAAAAVVVTLVVTTRAPDQRAELGSGQARIGEEQLTAGAHIADGRQVVLGAGATLVIEGLRVDSDVGAAIRLDLAGTQLFLESGSARFAIDAGESWRVHTPHGHVEASAAIARVQVLAGQSRVELDHGEAEVHAAGRSRRLRAGEAVRIEPALERARDDGHASAEPGASAAPGIAQAAARDDDGDDDTQRSLGSRAPARVDGAARLGARATSGADPRDHRLGRAPSTQGSPTRAPLAEQAPPTSPRSDDDEAPAERARPLDPAPDRPEASSATPPAEPRATPSIPPELERARAMLATDPVAARVLTEAVRSHRLAPAVEVEALMIEADAARRSGDLRGALALCEAVIAHPSGQLFAEEALLRAARILVSLGDPALASAQLTAARARFPRGALRPERETLTARLARERGDLEAARLAIESVPLESGSLLLADERLAIAEALAPRDAARARALAAPLTTARWPEGVRARAARVTHD